MQIADMSWVGSEASLTGSATYTVDEASMTLALPDFKTRRIWRHLQEPSPRSA